MDEKAVVRMNRDGAYSAVIVDVSAGAEPTMSQTGGRYQAAMIVDQDHCVDQVYDRPGVHELDPAAFHTWWVGIAAGTLVVPNDPDDVRSAAALQDQRAVMPGAVQPFTHPGWEAHR